MIEILWKDNMVIGKIFRHLGLDLDISQGCLCVTLIICNSITRSKLPRYHYQSKAYWLEWQVFRNKNIKPEADIHILFLDGKHVVYNFQGD